MIESYYSCMRGMRNSAVKESKEWENIAGKNNHSNFNVATCGQCSRFQLCVTVCFSAWAPFWVMMVRVLGHGLGLSFRGHSIASVT